MGNEQSVSVDEPLDMAAPRLVIAQKERNRIERELAKGDHPHNLVFRRQVGRAYEYSFNGRLLITHFPPDASRI